MINARREAGRGTCGKCESGEKKETANGEGTAKESRRGEASMRESYF